MRQPLKLDLDLTEPELMALAEMAKRFTYEHAVKLSNHYDGGRERDDMLAAICELQRKLARAGFAPR